MPKKSKKENGECLELKNINYQSMLLKNKIIVDNNIEYSNNAEEILEEELKNNKKKAWNKLSMTSKNNKIKKYSKKYASENNLNSKQKKILNSFLKDLLINKRICRNKDVDYDVSTGTLVSILNISFNSKTNRFTLKSINKKRSALSGISKKNLMRFKNKTQKNKKKIKNPEIGENL